MSEFEDEVFLRGVDAYEDSEVDTFYEEDDEEEDEYAEFYEDFDDD